MRIPTVMAACTSLLVSACSAGPETEDSSARVDATPRDDGTALADVPPEMDTATLMDTASPLRDTGTAADTTTTQDVPAPMDSGSGADSGPSTDTGVSADASSDAGSAVDAGSDAMPIDPRTPAERACPTGGLLEVQLWDTYATLQRPDGMRWDGPSSGTVDMTCSLTADALRVAVRYELNMTGPLVGTVADALVGDDFHRAVASLCGLAADWFTTRYEGPDMFARGAFTSDTAWRWETAAVQDSWRAHLPIATDGLPSSWIVSCGDTTNTADLQVMDEDLAFDDEVSYERFGLGDIPPEAICGGWAWLEGSNGLVGALFRVSVMAPDQNCAGIAGTTFEQYVIHPRLRRTPAGGPMGATPGVLAAQSSRGVLGRDVSFAAGHAVQ